MDQDKVDQIKVKKKIRNTEFTQIKMLTYQR